MFRCAVAAIAVATVLVTTSNGQAAPPSPPTAPASPQAARPSFLERHPDLPPPTSVERTPKEQEERERRRREHFEHGNAALSARDFKKCEEHFAQAWSIRSSAGVLANLGLCENELGYFVDAAEHLSRAKKDFDREGKSVDEIQRFDTMTEAELQRALKEVGTLDVENAPAGATISLGPKRTFRAPLERRIYLYPGDYTVEVRADERVIHTERLHVAAGQEYKTVVRPKEAAPPVPQPSPVAPLRAGPNVPLLVTGGVGAAAFLGMAVGFVAGSHARLNRAAQLRKDLGEDFGAQTGACHSSTFGLTLDRLPQCLELQEATADAATFEYVGMGALVASGALGLATTMYGLWPRPDAPPTTRSTGARVVHAGAALWPGGAGAVIGGVF